jgi:hypothetical protein
VKITEETCPHCMQTIERCIASGCGQRRSIPGSDPVKAPGPRSTPFEAAAAQKYHALCATCGYVGRAFENKADADVDGDEHEIAVGTNKEHHYTRTVSES